MLPAENDTKNEEPAQNQTNEGPKVPPGLPAECQQKLGQILISEEDICSNVDRYNRSKNYVVNA